MPSFSEQEYDRLIEGWRRQGVAEGRALLKEEMGLTLDKMIQMTSKDQPYRFPIWSDLKTHMCSVGNDRIPMVSVRSIDISHDQLVAIRILLCGAPERKR